MSHEPIPTDLGARLASVAVRAFAGTAGGVGLIGVLLAALSWWALSDVSRGWGLAVAALTVAEALLFAVPLGVKQAVAMAGGHALESLRLGAALLDAVLDRLPGRDRLEGTLRRLPLAEAEARLTDAVAAVAGAPDRGGWLRRAVRARLIVAVRTYTLARFRDHGCHSGIDAGKLMEEARRTVDAALARQWRAAARAVTGAAIVAQIALAAAQVALLRALLA